MSLTTHIVKQAVLETAAKLATNTGLGVLSRLTRWGGSTVLNYFEAALQSPDRSRIWSQIQDARFDVDAYSRSEVMRIARDFEQYAIPARFGEIFCQYTVGATGLSFTPASSDDAWNARWKDAWDTWCKFCDITSRQPFSVFQSLVAWRWFFDGEVFILKTHGGAPDRRPRIQLIESQRVATPPSMCDREGVSIFDGIQVDKNGRPIRYWIRSSFLEDKYEPYDAESVIHVFEPTRGGQLRGVTLLLSSLLDLHDLKDLQVLENRAAKKNAEIASVFKTRNGELPSSQSIRKASVTGQTTLVGGQVAEENRVAYINGVTGGKAIALRTDEEYIQPDNTRPSVASQGYWDYLLSKACAGVSIPKLLVFPFSLQGTVTRADLEVADSHFKSRSSVLQSAFLRVYEFVLSEMRWTDANVGDPPADYLKVSIRPPRSIKVDIGYDSAATLKEFEMGARTLESICSERNEDWREVVRQRGREARFILDTAAEQTIDPSMISTAIVDRPERISADPGTPKPAAVESFK